MAVISPNHIPCTRQNGSRGIQYRRAQAVALGAQRDCMWESSTTAK